jgi:hypothetical protein
MTNNADNYAMDLGEFQDFGFLQEANRKFFHPLGLALTVIIDDEGNRTGLFVQDWRDIDDEGGAFGSLDNDDCYGKSKCVAELYEKIGNVRMEKFGWIVQPIGHKFDAVNNGND